MKYLLILLCVCCVISCKAQSQISSLYDGPLDYGQTENAYHKDVDNDFNPYEGQWRYAANDTIIDITLEKIENYESTFPATNTTYFEDLIIGAFRFTVNGNVLVDTYSELNNQNITGWKYSVSGNLIFGANGRPLCPDCAPNERRVKLYLKDPNKPYIPMAMLLRNLSSSGQDRISIRFMGNGTWVQPDPDNPVEPTIPFGLFEFVRQ